MDPRLTESRSSLGDWARDGDGWLSAEVSGASDDLRCANCRRRIEVGEPAFMHEDRSENAYCRACRAFWKA